MSHNHYIFDDHLQLEVWNYGFMQTSSLAKFQSSKFNKLYLI